MRRKMPIRWRWKNAWPTRSGLRSVSINRSRGGSLTIRYRSLDQLDEVVRRLERKS